jgi:hypothetical protein
MATKKKAVNPLDFPKEIFVYDDEYRTRKDEVENAELDGEDLEDVILTDPCYIIVDGTLSEAGDFINGIPVFAKYVLVAVGKAQTKIEFKKV